jgi:O-antigen/teichoic acid export membrane protein
MWSNKKNSTWLAFQYIATLIISFVTLKLNLQYFGSELFGVWLVFLSFWALGGSVDLGFGNSLIIFISDAYKKMNYEKIQNIVAAGFVVFIALDIVLIGLGYVVADMFYFSNRKLVPLKYLQTGRWVFALLMTNFFFQYITGYFKSIIEGTSNFVITSKVALVNNLLILISVVVVVWFKLSLVHMAVFYAISGFITVILWVIIIYSRLPLLKLKLSAFNYRSIFSILNFSVNIQLAAILGALTDPVVKYLLGGFTSLSFVSYYEVARRLSTSISGLFSTTFRTQLTKSSFLGGGSELRTFILTDVVKMANLGVVYSGVFFGVFSVFSALIIHYWFGFDEIILMFLILMIPESISNFGFSFYVFLLGTGKTFLLAIIQFGNLVVMSVSVALSLILFKSYLGLLGLSISVVIANITMIYYTDKFVGVSFKEIYARTIINKLIILVLMELSAAYAIALIGLPFIVVLSLVSVIAMVVFYKEIKEYSVSLFVAMIKSKLAG